MSCDDSGPRRRPIRFRGHKVLQQRNGSDPWTDLTTLFVTIRDGEDGLGALLAQGILTLGIEDLIWQASSARFDTQKGLVGALIGLVPAARNAIAIAFIAKFAAFFGTTVFQAYGGLPAFGYPIGPALDETDAGRGLSAHRIPPNSLCRPQTGST
jgi:hypothetical protein